MAKISRDEFVKRLKKVSIAHSRREHIEYCISFNPKQRICFGTSTTRAPFDISLDDLYEAYVMCDKINTKTIKPFVNGRQSPALAILIEMGLA